jgi:hypothetical protein
MPMKMLFFSSDDTEVEQLVREFVDAAIPCEVHKIDCAVSGYETQAELWIQNDRDCHRALMLCVQRHMGFARRPEPVPELDFEYEN